MLELDQQKLCAEVDTVPGVWDAHANQDFTLHLRAQEFDILLGAFLRGFFCGVVNIFLVKNDRFDHYTKGNLRSTTIRPTVSSTLSDTNAHR